MLKKKLTSDGFPVREKLAPILAPLIAEAHGEIRERFYPPEVVVFAMMTGVLARDTTLSAAVARCNADRIQRGLEPASMNTAAFSEARTRLSSGIFEEASRRLATSIEEQMPEDLFWEGFLPFAIDGSTLSAADTVANQEAFPQHGNQKDGAGFPLMRIVLMQSLITGCVHDLAYGPFKGKETGEMALARQVLHDLNERTLLLGDRYFPSYFTMADLIQKNIHGLFQSHAARDIDFRRGQQIGVLDHLVEWDKPPRPSWMSSEEYEKYPEKIRLREAEITREIGNGEKMVVVTTLLDNQKFTKGKLAKYYNKRWKIELALRDLKDTFHMAHIDAKTPEMVNKVLWSHIMAYNSLRWHMVNAAILYKTKIENMSVKTSARVATENRNAILNSNDDNRPALFAALFEQMVSVPVGKRPGRSEPRAVKRRPKPFPRLNCKRSDWRAK
jgi:hypothetical protein